MTPILYFVIPCYNEEQVLPETSGLFLAKLNAMIDSGKISPDSRVMFVNDGSKDTTWDIIPNHADYRLMSSRVFVALLSFIGIIYALIGAISGNIVEGWTSTTCIICFVSGIQMISLGVIGEYVGKIYLETKHRPRYIIDERKNLKEISEE